MWWLFWSAIKPKLLSIWKPLAIVAAGLLLLMRLDWLKRKMGAQKEEIMGLRTKEKIRDEHEKIDQQGDVVRKEIADLRDAADARRIWDELRQPPKS